ncbi:MAG: type II secretion system protein [Clostridia bacterium]
MLKNYKSTKGITLIALVITIIVLLILAGVSIAMLTGDNGILTQAKEAKEANIAGTEKEQIKLAMQSLKMKKQADNVSTTVAADELQNQLIADGAKNVTVEAGENGSLVVKYADSKNQYTVNQNGEIAENGQIPGEPDKPGTETGGTLPSTADTKPFLPDGATVVERDLNKGVVIKDANGNEWTWIEVPKSIYANTAYNGGTAPTSSTDYAKIESTMQKYAEAYRKSGYTDTWQKEAQHGFASADEYNNHKNAMLKSVYENGGFYIGKYEVGTETLRTSKSAPLTTPVIKEGTYPYNYVTNKQAQEKSKELATGGKTSSLMFGIQWDLVLKHIENKQGKTQAELKNDSTTWGNYENATFEITKGKYANSTDYGETFTEVNGTYTKPASKEVLLTTGATERNSVLNIYDLAGNEYEWTLEKSTLTGYPSVSRGGRYNFSGSNYPASYRGNYATSSSNSIISFRPALW